MKFFTSEITYFLSNRNTKTNIKRLLRFLAMLAALIIVYTVLFHLIMVYEGEDYSWITGFYWVLTVMSTLGFGDITFTSDLGRIFSVVVLLSGMLSLLILLPFTFIEFFYAPWLEAQSKARAPRELPEDTEGHIIITHYNSISHALIKKLDNYNYKYVLLFDDLQEALEFHDKGYNVVFGELDDPKTYEKLRVHKAAMAVTMGTDMVNSNLSNTIRELDENITVVATANSVHSLDLLKLAGADHVLQMGKMLGSALARRTIGHDSRVHVVGRFKNLIIAEATAYETPLAGKNLTELQLREKIGVNIVGLWERGKFITPDASTIIKKESVLVMAGSTEQLRNYDELLAIYHSDTDPVIIIGAGRVGRGAAEAFEKRGMDYRIIDQNPERIKDNDKFIQGKGEDIKTLEKAGINETPCVLITTNDDDINNYLTIYMRSLRPNVQIISRVNLQRNVSTLHRAGADFVMSYATMGSNAIFNVLERDDVVMIAEGLSVFTVTLPDSLNGKNIIESGVRPNTGCSVLALNLNGKQRVNPDPNIKFEKGDELVLIGSITAEQKFMKQYVKKD